MWSLRHRLAKSNVGGLQLPKVVNSPVPLLDWPLRSESYSENFPSVNLRPNYWKLIEDPELPELIKIYNSRCRCWKDRKASVRDSHKVVNKSKLFNRNISNKSKLHKTEEKRIPGLKNRFFSLEQQGSNKSKLDIIQEVISHASKKSSSPDQKGKNKSELDIIEEIISHASEKSVPPGQNHSNKSKLDTIQMTDQKKSNKSELDINEEVRHPGPRKSSSPARRNSKNSKPYIIEQITFPESELLSDLPVIPYKKVDFSLKRVFRIPFHTTTGKSFQRPNIHKFSRNKDTFKMFLRNFTPSKRSHGKKALKDRKSLKSTSKASRPSWKLISQRNCKDQRRRRISQGNSTDRRVEVESPMESRRRISQENSTYQTVKSSKPSRRRNSQRNSTDQEVESPMESRMRVSQGNSTDQRQESSSPSRRLSSPRDTTDQKIESSMESHIIQGNSTEQEIQPSRLTSKQFSQRNSTDQRDKTSIQSTKQISQEKSTEPRVKSLRQSRKHIKPKTSRDQEVSFNDAQSYISKHSSNQRTRLDSDDTPAEENWDNPDTVMSSEKDNPVMLADQRPLLSISSLAPYPTSLLPQHLSAANFYTYNFDPIDLVKYKKDFLALHSQNPIATKGSWPTIWPKPLKHRLRKVKSEDPSPSLVKKRCKRRLRKSSPSRTHFDPIPCKYHSFNVQNFKICGNVSENERAVACQTEDLPEGSDLCNICGPPSQPDEPLPVKMKQCQDREALRRYYLRMCQRESNSVSVSDSTSSEKPLLLKEMTSWTEMRRQLEQCQAALDLCEQLVEAQLRLHRIRAQNVCCRYVPSLETVLRYLGERSTKCLET